DGEHDAPRHSRPRVEELDDPVRDRLVPGADVAGQRRRRRLARDLRLREDAVQELRVGGMEGEGRRRRLRTERRREQIRGKENQAGATVEGGGSGEAPNREAIALARSVPSLRRTTSR